MAIIVAEYCFVGGRNTLDFLLVAVPRRRLIDGDPTEDEEGVNDRLLPLLPLMLLDADSTDGRCILHDTYNGM
jgi:hypothetical protein